jgi:redox-sensitive bicupin YhaK (pirin superfamily)
MGNHGVVGPGGVQFMSAGTGVRHSESNASQDKPVHLLQIWILPDRQGITPTYEQQPIDRKAATGKLLKVAGPEGDGGAVTIHQDAALYTALLAGSEKAQHELSPGRHGWVQVALGSVQVNGKTLAAGDGAAISNESVVSLVGTANESEVLLFDLA